MERPSIIQGIQEKFRLMAPSLTERTKRIWCAVEARQLGRGGITIVQQATGVSMPTIRRGIAELEQPLKLSPTQSRVPGGGRKKLTAHYADLPDALETLIDPVMRGDPESPLRWTCKSTRLLSDELNRQGYEISPSAVRFLLHQLEYSLQGNRKTREGEDHPDRNEQFLYINDQVKRFLQAGQPVISVDTKKKENLGNFSNKGQEYHPKGKPLETKMHDFPDEELGKAIPYGVYDIGRNEGWVNVGIDHDTAQFAANSIRRWWTRMGSDRFPKATRLLMTADAGGSNGYKRRLWKTPPDQDTLAPPGSPPNTAHCHALPHR